MLIVTVFVNLGFRLEAVWRQSIITPFITITIIIEADTVVCVINFDYYIAKRRLRLENSPNYAHYANYHF